MFTTATDSKGRKSASSSYEEGKPRAPSAARNCCRLQTERKPQRSWSRSAGGCLGSGALLLFLPKCPMCIAAYLAFGTGASVAMPLATGLRPMLEIVFTVLAALLLARHVAMRVRTKFDRQDAC
jgi:hypothetical protein